MLLFCHQSTLAASKHILIKLSTAHRDETDHQLNQAQLSNACLINTGRWYIHNQHTDVQKDRCQSIVSPTTRSLWGEMSQVSMLVLVCIISKLTTQPFCHAFARGTSDKNIPDTHHHTCDSHKHEGHMRCISVSGTETHMNGAQSYTLWLFLWAW